MTKKISYLATTGALALMAATTFTGCADSDDVVEVNPTYDPVERTVTTQFVLNIASADMATRMSAEIVQKNNNFRGMQDAKLIGLATGYTGSAPLAPYNKETTATNWKATSGIKSKVYDLGTLYSSNAVDNGTTTPSGGGTATSNNAESSSHRVVELTLPLTTDAMLVYGRAIPESPEDANKNGKIASNIVATTTPIEAPEQITFDLVSRLADNEAYKQTCNLIALVLNRIMLSQVSEKEYSSSNLETRNGYIQKENLSALTWRDLPSYSSLSPLEENLATLYTAITSFTTSSTAIRSGSHAAISSMMKDIYTVVVSVYDATATNDAELNAQRLASEIKTRIERYFDATSTSAGVISGTFKLKSLGNHNTSSTLAYNLINNSENIPTAFQVNSSDFTSNGKYAKVTNDYIYNNTTETGFPTTFMLPEGVSQLYFTAFSNTAEQGVTGGFSYTNPSQSLIDISKSIDPEKYMYPSELLYFDNSALRVNDNSIEAKDYPNGYNTWDTPGNWTNWTDNGKVTSTTRSVAVKNNINYGVAMLQTSVALASGTEFTDNRATIVTTESDQKLTENQVKGFTLTGVLIGGQYKQLGWNFIAQNVDTENSNYIIYDNSINNGKIPTTNGNENYTLVFDNYTTANTQNDVLVALEFQNGNEIDFYGKGGIVTKGSKFYLVGKLELSKDSNNPSTVNWPTYYAIPPYTSGGTTETTRVFIQDYVTTATFTIGASSLKNAYNTVPDLRASQTSLGLSVDLNWRQGLTFNVDL